MSNTNDTPEERIRVRAHRLWLADGCPPGREDEYWERARELEAIVENPTAGQLPNPEALHHGEIPPAEPVEEAELLENLGEFPGRLTDQGDRTPAPMTRRRARKFLRES
jgi:DUF2934 family protein